MDKIKKVASEYYELLAFVFGWMLYSSIGQAAWRFLRQ